MNRNSLWVVAAVVAIVILVIGGCALDQQRRAAQAAEKVAEFATRCDTAPADFDVDYESAVEYWQGVIDAYSSTHYLGVLLTSPSAAQNQIITICAGTDELVARLENGDNRVAVYNDAEGAIWQLSSVVYATSNELTVARGALAELQSAESWRVEAYSRYENAPWDAVDLNAAYDELTDGDASLQYGWDAMFWSDWGLANLSGGYAIGWYQLAIEHSSSPTPTPEPTNTPEPTDTPEPYVPPPTIDWSTSSDQSGSTDDSTTDDYSDSGSWDDSTTDYSDSGSWDSGSDSGSWDDGGSDADSWESDGTDSGSWKLQLKPEPRRK